MTTDQFVIGNKTVADPGWSYRTRAGIRGGGLALNEYFFETGAGSSDHVHRLPQVALILDGSFEVTIGGERRLVRPGDSFYVAAGQEHDLVCIEAGSYVVAKQDRSHEHQAEGGPAEGENHSH